MAFFFSMPTLDLNSDTVRQFMAEHENSDPALLMLNASKFPDIPMRQVVAQIQARKKAKTKLAEWYAQPRIIFPPVLSVEQASSELTARYKSKLMRGESLLDLTGGMGVDTFYLGQSFNQVTYVEQNEALVSLARHNFSILKARHIEVYQADAVSYLHQTKDPFDCIYIDPARRNRDAHKIFELEGCTPNVLSILGALLKKGKQVFVKTAPLLDVSAAVNAFKQVEDVWVLAVRQECKEILYKLSANGGTDPVIHTVHLHHDEEQHFAFTTEDEARTVVEYAKPQTFIYEPNPAILKAGAFKSLAKRYQLLKLHPNSHLYTSAQKVTDFPGRGFKLSEISKYNRKALKRAVPSAQANITTRNFPDSVKHIRKKTGLREGGDVYIFATTDIDNQLQMLICKKLNKA